MQVNIIGGGISGLTAAYYLEKDGHDVNIIEKTDRIGGRMKTDEVDGFLLDRGFQVFLTAYPEARAILDYEALDLKYLMAGSAIFTEDGMKEIGDPARELSLLLKTIGSPLASFSDKLGTYALKRKMKSSSIDKIFSLPNKTTLSLLQDKFSDKYIQSFFGPFYKGIFLENKLDTSSQMFQFVFKMFSEGFATVPALGMEEIPKQLASKLLKTRYFLNEEVVSIKDKVVTTHSGKAIEASVTLIATEAKSLAKEYAKNINTDARGVSNIYFSADSFDYDKPGIMLTPNAQYVNNVCCMSKVSEAYATNGKHLISVSVISTEEKPLENIEELVLTDLKSYYDTKDWKHIKTYHIPYALPNQDKVINYQTAEHFQISDKLFICGDHLFNGSINAAMKTGRLAAKSIVKSLSSE